MTRFVEGCLGAVAVVFALLTTTTIGQSVAGGGIIGTVRCDGTGLPGASVTVATPGLTRSVVADAGGRFEFLDLPQGGYSVTAQLAGFQTRTEQSITVAAGRTATVNLVLSVGCLDQVVYADMGILWALHEADAVLHLRITGAEPRIQWPFRTICLIGTEHRATLVRALAIPPGRGSPGNTIRFVQEGSPYPAGQEYVALLRWEPSLGRFHPVTGPVFMFPVRGGRVVCHRTDAPSLRDGMSVDDFLAALGALRSNAPAK